MSLYRKAVWFYKGYHEYTKPGYIAASKHFQENDLTVDCSGKSYMVTGANSGIGKSLTHSIAKRGGTVHMICRNVISAEEVKSEIINLTKNDKIIVHQLDLSQPREVYKFAKRFIESGSQLDVLINNAGTAVTPRQVDEDGFDKNFATNTFSLHILIKTLLPALIKSEDGRVVNVSSGGMLLLKLDTHDLQFEKMNPYDNMMAYAQNKRQQVVMTQVHAKQHKNVFFACMHPGWADTPSVRQFMPDFYNKMKNRLRTADEGADTALWLAVSPSAIKQQSGLFFQDRTPVSTHLPLAWTKTTDDENNNFVEVLEELFDKIKTNTV